MKHLKVTLPGEFPIIHLLRFAANHGMDVRPNLDGELLLVYRSTPGVVIGPGGGGGGGGMGGQGGSISGTGGYHDHRREVGSEL